MHVKEMVEERIAPLIEAAKWLWRNRKVTVPVALSLALGIGANTAIFTIVDAAFLEPLPFRDAERLVSVTTHDPRNPGYHAVSFPNYLDLSQKAHTFEQLAAAAGARVNVTEGEQVVEANAEMVTGNFFQVMGVTPALGSGFEGVAVGESTEVPQIVLSDAFWRKRFHAASGIVGKTVLINRAPFQVAGVMPRSFKGLDRVGTVDVWISVKHYSVVLERPDWMLGRRALMFMVVGRLKQDATTESAGRDVELIGKELAGKYPDSNAGRGYRVLSLEESTLGPARRGKWIRAAVILMGAAGTVLLIAIANVGNLLLSRASQRRKDMAVRIALGATRRTLFQQILIESALLVAVGGLLGLAVGFVGREMLWRLRPQDVTVDDIWPAFNGRVLLFAAVLSLLTGFLASFLPAWETLRGNLTSELRERFEARRHWRQNLGWRPALVIGQVALSMVALLGADVFLKSLSNAYAIDPGFDTHSLAFFEVNARRLGLDGKQRMDFYLELQRRMESLPGVQSVTVSSNPLIGMDTLRRSVIRFGEGWGKGATIVRTNLVATHYFATTDVLILRGRDFQEADHYDAQPVAIVNETMARKLWPNEVATGKKFVFFGETTPHLVVGVARDSIYSSPGETPEPLAYTPLMQGSPPAGSIIVRTAGQPGAISEQLAAAVKAYRPDVPELEVMLATEAIDRALWAPRMAATLLATFGLLALILSSVGVYAVTAQMVSQRTSEMGVRMALGACPVDVMELVLRQCFTLVLPGLAIGNVVSFLLARFGLQNVLYGVNEMDLEPYLLTSLLLALVALAAMYLPARRMIRIPPAMVLREQ